MPSGPEGIALKHIEGGGSEADWRVLNFGWATADAVLTTGANLRNESGFLLAPMPEGMREKLDV